MTHKLTLISFCLILGLSCSIKILAQPCSCTGVASVYCATDAATLFDLLDPSNLNGNYIGAGTQGNPKILSICGTINLGELTPGVFPLEIPQYVTLQGNNNLLGGSRIVFPYRYKYGKRCGMQFTNAQSTTVPEDEPGHHYDTEITPELLSMSSTDLVFVFAMQKGSRFNNICLQGPKTDIKEEYMYAKLNYVVDAAVCSPPLIATIDALEGLGGGILMRGDDAQINNSEIYGFATYNVHIRPEVNSGADPKGLGTVSINNSFLHNSKLYGYGYALFGSAGGGAGCQEKKTCTTPLAKTWVSNSDQQQEYINVEGTSFMENGKEADGAGHRYAYTFTNCTMGLRVNNYIMNQHPYTTLCNHWLQSSTLICSASTLPECCSYKITNVGGESVIFTNNFFLKGALEFNFCYPNTTTFNPAVICSTMSVPVNAELTLDENVFLGTNTITTNRIKIAETDHHNWDFQHFLTSPKTPTGPLNTLNVFGANGNLTFLEKNDFRLFSDNTVSGIPHVRIDAQISCFPQPNTTPTSIFVGDYLQFNTDNCLDAMLNPSVANNSMIYFWRFHQLYDDTYEIRTEHVDAGNALIHTFDKIGITNVNLIGYDRNTHTMSYIATHPVTVKPVDDDLHLVFNIRDTYDGPWLHPNGTLLCDIDKSEIILPKGSDFPTTNTCPKGICPGDVYVPTITNFKKYVKINGVIIWTEDVGEDPGGWERVEYPRPGITSDPKLDTYLCTDDRIAVNLPGGCSTLLLQDQIEIGLMVMNAPVDASNVRGINIYLDDVYISQIPLNSLLPPGNAGGENILVNGDFENYNGNLVPSGWNLPFCIDPNPAYSSCYPSWTNPSQNDSKLSVQEVRSGLYSLWYRLKFPVNNQNTPYQSYFPILGSATNPLPYFTSVKNLTFSNLLLPAYQNLLHLLQQNLQ